MQSAIVIYMFEKLVVFSNVEIRRSVLELWSEEKNCSSMAETKTSRLCIISVFKYPTKETERCLCRTSAMNMKGKYNKSSK